MRTNIFLLTSAFINRSFLRMHTPISKPSLNMEMHMPIWKPIPIDKQINIHYKLNNEQLTTICNNLKQQDKYRIIPTINNEFMLTVNLLTSTLNQTVEYKTYLSIAVKDKFIGIYGHYILEYIDPIKFTMINNTNQYLYLFSNITLLSLYFNYSYDKSALIDNKYNFVFKYDNTTDDIIFYTDINRDKIYLNENNNLSNFQYKNHIYYTASKITYSIDEYQFYYLI